MDNQENIDNLIELKESIKSIVELTTRVDERVQNVIKQQLSIDEKINRQSEAIGELNTKVKILESHSVFTAEDKRLAAATRDELHRVELKINELQQSNNSQEQRWKAIFSFSVQLIWVILAAYLLYKMGIQSPDVP